MRAFLFIQEKRKSYEKMDFVTMLRLAKADQKAYEQQMERWARDAEVSLRFEE